MIFIFPTYEEAEPFVALCPTARVEVSGVGMAACGAVAARIIRENPDEMFILAGIAGTYDTRHARVCEVVEVTEERIGELPVAYQLNYKNKPKFPTLRGVTSNTVSIPAQFSSMAIENMEGAAFFAVCRELGVRCAQIRAISNRVGEPYSTWWVAEALEALAEVLKGIVQCE